MSGEALYERYKDALKRGHVAALRGRLEEALKAYAEAAAIAPERSTPHTSAGAALMRRKRAGDALRHYAAALVLAPRDEAALLGRAQALAALDRRPEAADAFDTLAEMRASVGKLADAVDAARRGLELAEGRERRRTLERLIDELRANSPSEPGRLALERALRVLEGPAVLPSPPMPVAPPDMDALESEATALAADAITDADVAEDVAAGAPGEVARPSEDESGVAATAPEDDGAAEEAVDGAADEAPATAAEPAEEPAEEPAIDAGPAPDVPRGALDRDVPDDVDVVALSFAAEQAVDRRDADALDRLLDLAAVHRREERTDSALDACYLALSIEPDDVGLHLGLVELFDDRGWASLAAEKLDLLDRIVALDGDAHAIARVAAARTARG